MEVIGFLFPPFVACAVMIGIFGYLGIHVLEREIVFIDIALAQVAAVGTVLVFTLWRIEDTSIIAYFSAFGFTILAAFFYSQIIKRVTQITQEAIIGVSYAVSAALALFLLALAAGGDVHLEHMLTGSILWAKWHDILICTSVYLIVGLFHYIFRNKFTTLSKDYRRTIEKDSRAAWWDFLFYVSMGLVITISVRIGGVLAIFSFLIIPTTFAAIFTSSWFKRMLLAWLLGISASIVGLAFSYSLDFSCGPSVVSFMGLALIVAAIVKRSRRVAERGKE